MQSYSKRPSMSLCLHHGDSPAAGWNVHQLSRGVRCLGYEFIRKYQALRQPFFDEGDSVQEDNDMLRTAAASALQNSIAAPRSAFLP